MSITWAKQIPKGSYFCDAVDKTILIDPEVFQQIADYSRSNPTGPSPGRVYRKNHGWPSDMDDNWFVYFCEEDPTDPKYVLHHAWNVLNA